MIKIGVVGTTGGWSSEMLADAIHARTGFRLLVDLNHICVNFESGRVWYKDTDLFELDALIIKKAGVWYSPDLMDRLELLRYLYERGVKMFSSPFKIMRVLDRLSCTVTLRIGNIPMPPTTITEDIDAALNAVEYYGEAVLKPLYTSKARGMMLIQAGPNARQQLEQFKQNNSILYIQKKLELNGRDLGVAFLGGRYLATYARRNKGNSWNTTTRSGGVYEPYEPPIEVISLAYQAQELFNLDFTSVDIAETEYGPMVFEVSAFGGFRGLQTACNIDAAGLYADYVLEKLKKKE